jgi:hypothetical protein
MLIEGTVVNVFSLEVQDLDNGIYKPEILTQKNQMIVKSMNGIH